jgi:isocitrate lyase
LNAFELMKAMIGRGWEFILKSIEVSKKCGHLGGRST